MTTNHHDNDSLDRRSFLLQIVALWSSAAIPFAFAQEDDPETIRAAIVDKARSYYKASDWAPRSEFGPLNKAYYCNVFVADVCREVGAASWDRVPGLLGILTSRDPLAHEWEDPNFYIRGWEVVYHSKLVPEAKDHAAIFNLRKPGDVISGGGHMGILSDDRTSENPKVFSASAITGAVEANDWSYRLPNPANFKNASEWGEAAYIRASIFTVRRFIGNKLKPPRNLRPWVNEQST
jgi:hypothetical protein